MPVTRRALFEKFLKMSDKNLTWEQAVLWLRDQPEQQSLVQACYYDDPLLEAAQRFANSDEWEATQALLPKRKGRSLDLGAGRGISSYALTLDGWDVTALEPDPSLIVGSGAIRALSSDSGLPIGVVEEYAETLPFETNAFDLVYGRQVLHHARDLAQLCREVSRVLKPNGAFIATREHVLSHKSDLPIFLDNHPLHKLYGGENAFILKEYLAAITGSALQVERVIGPFESAINYFPLPHEEWYRTCVAPLARIVSRPVATRFTQEQTRLGRWLLAELAHLRSNLNHSPGRLYSFVARKLRS